GPARQTSHHKIRLYRIWQKIRSLIQFVAASTPRKQKGAGELYALPSILSQRERRTQVAGALGNQGRETVREAPGDGSPFLRGLDRSAAPFFGKRTSRKNGAVRLIRFFATCSGVPVATISPPASPASGPISTM